MDMNAVIARINELAAKNKAEGLTEEELVERDKLRRMYIDNVTGNLKGQLDRRAKFVSVVTLCFPNGDVLTARGECHGTIAYAPQGENGFGYDPVFFVTAARKTFAQLTEEEKNALSHRGNALKEFKMKLEAYLDGTDK